MVKVVDEVLSYMVKVDVEECQACVTKAYATECV